ncbi:hypothetical protein CS006_09295 [Bifidobacterium primatium]|uniref:Antitoxin SocA-like Panacea domain-containing protein n=2 Tax=Bifidobacterium TaxID=1678 RepID=A0A2M9H7E6_9BIFI|nr:MULTISPECIES: type II toxin-antitoxin system antitoxin SocA domain-containing protein [Bifidobacterium]NEG95632.1 DUF4065 domain-containing protein [Bifidobacterium sp. SMB2]NEH11945.1 DUF4065 domain-containing protein [Bifidobacterium saimiriisciurei]PJM72744.1 hypothetical protein CS006_09295 [Bifidobacterium primatium]
MKSLDVANYFIANYGDKEELTNLKLNKLVYFAQALHLKRFGSPLFDDEIQAWDYGPVEPLVYRTFRTFGSARIFRASGDFQTSEQLASVAKDVMGSFGRLTAFDLVRRTHRKGSAWDSAYVAHENNAITNQMILDSKDWQTDGILSNTLAEGIERVNRSWPNALRMLENS